MKNALLLLMAIAMITIVSCKKEKTNTPVDLTGKVKSIFEEGAGKTTWHGYDSTGRLSFIAKDGDTTKYRYTFNSVTITKPGDTTTYTLNAVGLAVSSSKGETFAYNTEGYMSAYHHPTYYDVTYHYDNDDMTTFEQDNITGNISYCDTLENRNDHIGERTYYFAVGGFFGKRSRHLVQVNDFNGFLTDNHWYELDAAGRVKRDSLLNYNIVLGTQTVINRYTYY